MHVNWWKMRDFRLGGGSLLLLFALCATTLGQVTGQVESIGFDNRFRAECWTPMVIDLRPETSKLSYPCSLHACSYQSLFFALATDNSELRLE